MLKEEILKLVKQYYEETVVDRSKFIPGETFINFGGSICGVEEFTNLMDEALVFWLSAGKWTTKFEKGLQDYLGGGKVLAVNSGSSANLLAFSCLTSWKLGDRQILPGDEVISVAAGFPTTITPAIQYGAVPVFVDVDLDTLNINIDAMKSALTDKTKAVMVASTLGNPLEFNEIEKFCKDNNLWFINDNCDALGSVYHGIQTGAYGDIATQSFYPPHHITTGEGGACAFNNPKLYDIGLSMRNWGRDCNCNPGQDNRCGKRHNQQHGKLPFGYDHKYVSSHFGYNLKFTDMQAAIGCAQLERLQEFTNKRINNWSALYHGVHDLPMKLMAQNGHPSPFGFTMICSSEKMCRDLTDHLEKAKIQTRKLFMGNITKQPCFTNQKVNYRVVGNLDNTDMIMNNLVWVGCYPGIDQPRLDYMIKAIREFYGRTA